MGECLFETLFAREIKEFMSGRKMGYSPLNAEKTGVSLMAS